MWGWKIWSSRSNLITRCPHGGCWHTVAYEEEPITKSSFTASSKKKKKALLKYCYFHSHVPCIHRILYNWDLKFSSTIGWLSNFRRHCLLIIISHILPGGCASIKMPFIFQDSHSHSHRDEIWYTSSSWHKKSQHSNSPPPCEPPNMQDKTFKIWQWMFSAAVDLWLNLSH